MTTFFTGQNSPTPQEQYRKHREELDKDARIPLTALTAELRSAFGYLKDELVNRGVATEVEVVEIRRKHPNRPSKHDKTITKGRGWVVSEAKTYAGSHAVCLLTDGRLLMTSAVENSRAEEEEALDLNALPVHPAFATEHGYCETHGRRSAILAGERPDLPYKQESYGPDFTTQLIAINLEYLERDALTNGRRLLGIT